MSIEKFNSEQEKIERLKFILEESGIDTSSWGQGPTKCLEDLQREIEEGESVLEKNENGELIRKISLVCIFIYYKDKFGKTYFLNEDRQVFNNGSERKRDINNSVTEKIKKDEDVVEAAKRGIVEELGIEDDFDLEDLGVENEEKLSHAYPNLKTQSIQYKFKVFLNDTQFNPEGYIENQPNKSTYFVWEELEL